MLAAHSEIESFERSQLGTAANVAHPQRAYFSPSYRLEADPFIIRKSMLRKRRRSENFSSQSVE